MPIYGHNVALPDSWTTWTGFTLDPILLILLVVALAGGYSTIVWELLKRYRKARGGEGDQAPGAPRTPQQTRSEEIYHVASTRYDVMTT